MNWHDEIGKQHDFQATVGDIGKRFFVLQDVTTPDGDQFRDHVWLRYCRKFKGIRTGDHITLTAKVNTYRKQGQRQLTLTNIKIN